LIVAAIFASGTDDNSTHIINNLQFF